MASTATSYWTACPKCGEKLAVRPEHAGKRGKCQKCGEVFQITLHAEPRTETANPSKSESGAKRDAHSQSSGQILETPEHSATVTFSCSLCQTRITVGYSQIGHTVACPDCGRKNVVPPPPAPKKPVVPAAMIGPQYELWGVDEGPNAARAKPPRLHPVYCLTCGTLMYARDEHLGKKLKCPDCGALTLATPREEKAQQSVLVPDGEEYQVDETATPPPRPASMAQVLEAENAERLNLSQIPAVTAAMAARQKEVYVPPPPRPKRPRNPLFTGAWRMIATQEVIARWIALSILAGFVIELLSEALLSPMQGMVEALKIVFAAVGVVLGGIWLFMAGPLLVAIVGESGDGNDELHQPPSMLAFDCLGELFSVVMAGTIAGVLALGAGELAARAGLPVPARIATGVSVVVLVFPFGLLSTLLEGSPIGIISPRLLTSVGKLFGPWLLFYLESFLLAAIVGGVAWLLGSQNASGSSRELSPAIVWGLPPLVLAALLIDMRLLGRLAWWISDSILDEDDDQKEK